MARAHSADMATKGYFDHTSPDGRSPFDRMRAAGYRGNLMGENIAAGQRTAAAVETAWMNSPGHRANILNCGYKVIGIGVATRSSSPYGIYWTQDFGIADRVPLPDGRPPPSRGVGHHPARRVATVSTARSTA